MGRRLDCWSVNKKKANTLQNNKLIKIPLEDRLLIKEPVFLLACPAWAITLGCKFRTRFATVLYSFLYKKGDRKSTRLNSSHVKNSYAVFCVNKRSEDDKSELQVREKL